MDVFYEQISRLTAFIFLNTVSLLAGFLFLIAYPLIKTMGEGMEGY